MYNRCSEILRRISSKAVTAAVSRMTLYNRLFHDKFVLEIMLVVKWLFTELILAFMKRKLKS